ncbi:hypothetical protein QJQ45_004365 [Haematococcus lacustris]|nr:hypothetical protein QJQ45_004365 [Haematococcus lacustris]
MVELWHCPLGMGGRSHAISGARRLPSRVLLALALALLLCATCCAVTASPASQLQACFNRNASAQAPYYFEDYVTGRPSRWLCLQFWVEANPTSCAMRLLLVTEMLGEQSALLLFPLHSLRNMALLTADTPLVAMIDVDLVLSSTLSDEFSGLAGRRGNVSSLLILPAFEFCEQGEHDLPKRTAMAAEIAMGEQLSAPDLLHASPDGLGHGPQPCA